MCTLVVLHRAVPGAPLVVAANRDEFLGRPAVGPALGDSGGRAIVAPRDVQAGGTWLGVNAAGVFAAVTNVTCGNPDPQRRSRGLLVLDALAAGSAREAVARSGALEAGAYNPCNFVVADGREAYAVSHGERPCRRELEPGVHVVGNAPLGAPAPEKVDRLARRARRLAGAPVGEALAGLSELCRSHDADGPRLACCVHGVGYGTRSSTLLAWGDRFERSVLKHAEGAPCQVPYEDFTPLLLELGRGARFAGEENAARKVS